MIKYEYYCCWVECFNSNALQKFLNEQGLEGWELVEMIHQKDNYNTLIVMKRPLQEID